jgi:phage terminase small subunit
MPACLRLVFFLLLISLCSLTLASDDDDRPDHFEGEPSRTLEEALQNFSEANARLAEIVGQDSPDTQAVFEVHQLTYTLENAVDKIRDEMEDLAEVLEEVHKASERNDGETVTARGRVYLEKARKIAP